VKRELLDIFEAANYIARNEAYMRRLVASREIAFIKVGRLLRFDPRDLDAHLDAGRVERGGRVNR
jgi:excisionase family DNA binding protein